MNAGWIACVGVVVVTWISEIFWKSYLSGYATQKGKLLATHEDIEKVLEQVRAVTRETEIVKAEISGGLWQRQWHLTQKRDCYARLVDSLENVQLQRSRVRNASQSTVKEARRSKEEAILEFRRARAMARLILPPEVVSGMSGLLREIEGVDPQACSEYEMACSKKRITTVRDAVAQFGRGELGFADDR